MGFNVILSHMFAVGCGERRRRRKKKSFWEILLGGVGGVVAAAIKEHGEAFNCAALAQIDTFQLIDFSLSLSRSKNTARLKKLDKKLLNK